MKLQPKKWVVKFEFATKRCGFGFYCTKAKYWPINIPQKGI